MAVTEQSYTGNGSTTNYSFTFPYLKSTDIEVQVDATVTTAWSLANATTVQFNTAPSNGAKIKILRQTNVDNLTATFYAGSAIKSEDLNDNYTQNLYKTQEIGNRYFSNTGGTMTGDLTMGEDASIIFEGATDNAHETTVTVTDPTADRTITIPNVTGTVVTTGDSGTVTSTMIADATIATADIANSAVTTAKIAADAITGDKVADNAIGVEHLEGNSVNTGELVDSAVTTAKIAGDAVTGAKIADDAIDSEHYTDGSIDTAHIGDNQVTTAKIPDGAITTAKIVANAVVTASINADAVTGAKIADDAIDSEHYTDASIDTAHIADAQITTAKIANTAVTNAKLGADCITQDKVADDAIRTEHLADQAVTTALIADAAVNNSKLGADCISEDKIADDAVREEHLADNAVTTARIAGDAINADKIADNAVTTDHIADAELTTLAGMQSGTASILAGGTALAATLSEINTICDGKAVHTTISDSDAHYPTSGAVVDYVAAQIAPIGGLEVIANEDAFPTTQPASGVVISIADAAGVVINGSGVSTTARTSGNGSDNVTINNFPSSLYNETLASGNGLMVTSTGSSHTYNYHKLLASESDVKQLSDDINDFNSRYRIASSAPGSNNDEGDLYFDTNTNKMYVYDGSAWGQVTSTGDFKFLVPVDAGTTTAATWDGSDTSFDLKESTTSGSAASVTSVFQLFVSVNGVIQKPNSGSWSGSGEGFYLTDADTIRFATAPPANSNVFIVQMGSALSLNVPADNTVATAKIQNGAVTLDKMASDAVDEDNLKISNAGSNGQYLQKQSGNTGGLTWADVTAVGGANAVAFNDNVAATFGAGNDLEIKHVGDQSYINDNGAGQLYIQGSTFVAIRDSDDGDMLGKFTKDGSVELYHNNSKKIETTSAGITVTGGATFTGDITFDNQSNAGRDVRWDESVDSLEFDDNTKATFGADGDLQIYHDGSNSYIQDAGTGELRLRTNTGTIRITKDDTETLAAFNVDGASELYYDNSKKLTTDSTGISVFGSEGNSSQIHFKADDGDDNPDIWRIIGEPSGPELNFQSYNSGNYTNNLRLTGDQGCELYYNNGIKLATTNTGATVTGDVKATYPLGRRNHLINGSMRVAQYPANNTAINTYGPVDRWRSYGGALDLTVSHQSSAIAYDSGYALRFARNASTSQTNATGICQGLQSRDSYCFAGKKVTLSFKAECGANYSPTSNILVSYIGTGEGTNENPVSMTNTDWNSQNNTLSTSVQTFTHSHTIDDDKTQMTVRFEFNPTGTAGANDWFQIGDVQLEIGEATPFELRPYAEELAECQYYYQKYMFTNQTWIYNEGNAANLKWIEAYFSPMRTSPTVSTSDLSTGSGTEPAGHGDRNISSYGSVSASGIGGTNARGRCSIRATFSDTWGDSYRLRHLDGLNGDVVTFQAEL